MNSLRLAAFGALLLLPLNLACGDKDDDGNGGDDTGETDGGGEDGGAGDGGSGDGGTGDGGAGDGGTGDGGAMEMDCETTIFGKLPLEGKKAFMNECVLPPMRTAFQSFDSEAFATFNCDTCHGEGASASDDFRMPGVAAFPTDPTTWPPGYQTFMANTVVPTMIDILQAEPFDPKTGRGFSCTNCHERAK